MWGRILLSHLRQHAELLCTILDFAHPNNRVFFSNQPTQQHLGVISGASAIPLQECVLGSHVFSSDLVADPFGG